MPSGVTLRPELTGATVVVPSPARPLHPCRAAVSRLESRKVAAFHETNDIFLTPNLAKPPVPVGAVDMSFGAAAEFMPPTTGLTPDTRLAKCTDQPSMSVPLTWSERDLPIGTLFTARFGDEATLFRLAGQLERARPWWERRPAVFG